MVAGIMVKKRDGRKEPFSMEKIIKMYNFCKQGLNINDDKFWNEFKFTLTNNISTKEIQQNLITTANKLSVEDLSKIKEYSILAGRFYLLDWIKEIKLHREKEYKTLTDDYGFFKSANDWIVHLERFVKLGIYDERILSVPKRILKKLYTWIKKVQLDYDYEYPYFMWNDFYYQINKFAKSYIIKYDNKPVETFAEALLLVAILGFLPDLKKDRDLYVENVKKFTKLLFDRIVIPATPQLLNLRRKNGNLASCNILDIHDDIESIFYSLNQIALISKRAGGIGVYLGEIRPQGSYLMGNKGKANSVLNWVKLIDDTLHSVNQGGLRAGSATVALPIWHLDILDLIQVRNPVGEIRHKFFNVYPQVLIYDLFMERVRDDKDWTFIDHYELKKKYDIDLEGKYGKEFNEVYLKAEELVENGKVRGKKLKAREVYRHIIKNLIASGLPYIVFIDTVNNNSRYLENVKCLNLCIENYSPFSNTKVEGKKPHEQVKELGYIHSCNLLSLNIPLLHEKDYLYDLEKLEDLMQLVVRYMDNILDITVAPVKEVENHMQDYRTLGIGFVGMADFLVKISLDRRDGKFVSYRFSKRGDKQSLFDLIGSVFSLIAYFSYKASLNLAKERGKAEKFNLTDWVDYLGNSEVINVLKNKGLVDNNEINEFLSEARKYGLRNTMFLNCPPNTSTSVYAGTTASIYPPFSLVQSEKQSSGVYVVFPRYIQEGLFYYDEYSKFDEQDLKDIVDYTAYVQKFIDSGISFEYPINIRDGFIPESEIGRIVGEFIYRAWKKGVKALYYARIIAKKGQSGMIDSNTCTTCAN
jgi:ribonucleoside-diphosphate reductase alpha chain